MLHAAVEMKEGWFVKVPYYFTKGDMWRYRFDPMTIGLGLMVGGQVLSSRATLKQGEEAEDLGKFRQQQLITQAKADSQEELIAGAERAKLQRDEARRMTASQIAAVSASGSGFVGSNLVVIAESARLAEMDAVTIERNSQKKARAMILSARDRGAWERYEGEIAKRNARTRAYTDILGTAGKAFMMYKQYG